MTPRSQSRFCYDLWQSWATASQFALTRHRDIDVNASINSWYGVGKFKKMTCCWVMQQKFVRNSWHSPLLPPVSHLLYTISSLPSPISHLSSLFYPLSSSLFLTPLPSLRYPSTLLTPIAGWGRGEVDRDGKRMARDAKCQWGRENFWKHIVITRDMSIKKMTKRCVTRRHKYDVCPAMPINFFLAD